MSSISRDDDIMNTGVEANPPLDKRNREMRPERIEVGDEVLERNDIIAKSVRRERARLQQARPGRRTVSICSEDKVSACWGI